MFNGFKKIPILSLLVTQSGLRENFSPHMSSFDEMLEFVKAGKKFNLKNIKKYRLSKYGKSIHQPSLDVIVITKFEDGKLYIRDGHHRVKAIYNCRPYLHWSEYRIEEHKYEDFCTLNPEAGWVTPFDPRNEIRLPEFHEFKKKAMNLRHHKMLRKFVDANHNVYKKGRLKEVGGRIIEVYTNILSIT